MVEILTEIPARKRNYLIRFKYITGTMIIFCRSRLDMMMAMKFLAGQEEQPGLAGGCRVYGHMEPVLCGFE